MIAVLSDETRVYYEIYRNKNKKTLIFLHGNMEDSSFFINQINYFKENYQVLVYDSRGHGKSEWGDLTKYSIKQMAMDLNEMIALLKLDNCYIVGFSDGANIAMEFAVRYPNIIKGLALVGGNLRPLGLKLGVLVDMFKEYILSYGKPEGLRARKKLGLMLFEPNIGYSKLALINVPTMVIAGENDLIKRKETMKIASLIKGSKMFFVDGEDHFFIYNNPSIFNKMLEVWIYSV